MGRLERMRKRGGKGGFGDLLVGQLLLVILLYVSVVFYEKAKELTIGITFVLLAGILYFSWKGMRQLWFNKGSK